MRGTSHPAGAAMMDTGNVTVVEHIVRSGRRLFSARSLLPLIVLPAVVLAMPESARLEQAIGHNANKAIQWISLLVAFAGIALRCATVATAPDGTSSRDTRALRAPSLNHTGMYSIVRHPLYVGNGLMWIGVAASMRVWWLVLIVALAYALYIERVMAYEETFLEQSFGDAFRRWAARTPAFVPRWSAWIPTHRPVSWRRVASEHNGLLAIAIVFPLLQLQGLMMASTNDWLLLHRDLLLLFAVGIAVSIVAIVFRRWPERPVAAHSTDAAAPQPLANPEA
jgi:protein-S-isoprenylcysteine O-methyltransferase Ste14